jgi:hypothetical protein
MNLILLTGIIILIIVAISFIFISIKLKTYSVKHKSITAEIISNWCSSISSGAVFTLVIGLILFFFPTFKDWNTRKALENKNMYY